MASPSETARAAILGVPYDPNKKPDRVMTVKAFEQMDAKVIGVTAGAIIRDTLTGLNAVTNPPAQQMAWVLGDAAPANNGVYENTGSPSAPVWVRRGDLPYSIIRMINVGAGTPDAIAATSSLPAPSAPGAALFSINIVAENTGPVTLNGKPLRTNSGNEIAPGGLTAGSIHAFLDLGDHFRLLSDQASAAIVAAAEAAQIDVELRHIDYRKSFLGTFATDPATDLDGNPLIVGAEYFNNVDGLKKVWDGSAWTPSIASVLNNSVTVLKFVRGAAGPVDIRSFIGGLGSGGDDTDHYEDAADYLANVAGGGTLLVPGGSSVIARSIAFGDRVRIELYPDAVLDWQGDANRALFEFAGAVDGATVEVAASISRGDAVLHVDSGDEQLFAPGDVLKISTTEIYAPARLTLITAGELCVVRSVDTPGEIQLWTPVRDNYTTSGETVTLYRITPARGAQIDGNGALIRSDGVNNARRGVTFENAVDPLIRNINFSGVDSRAFMFRDCIAPRGDFISCEHAESSSDGYGGSFADATRDGLVTRLRGLNVRHLMSTNNFTATGGVVRDCAVLHYLSERSAPAIAGSGGDAMDTHAASDGIEYSYGRILGATGTGIIHEGRNFRAHHNYIERSASHGMLIQPYSKHEAVIDIQNNTIVSAGGDGIRVQGGMTGNSLTSGVIARATIAGNEIISPATIAVYVRTVDVATKNTEVVIRDNKANDITGADAFLVDRAVNVRFTGNSGRAVAQDGAQFQNVDVLVGDHGDFDLLGTGAGVRLNSAVGRTHLVGGRAAGASATGLVVASTINNVRSHAYDADLCATAVTPGTGTGHDIQYVRTVTETIASGVVSRVGRSTTLITVDTEGSASSDDLVTIAGGNVLPGHVLCVSIVNSARIVTVKDAGGNIRLAGGADWVPTDNTDVLTLVWRSSGYWSEVSRSDN